MKNYENSDNSFENEPIRLKFVYVVSKNMLNKITKSKLVVLQSDCDIVRTSVRSVKMPAREYDIWCRCYYEISNLN